MNDHCIGGCSGTRFWVWCHLALVLSSAACTQAFLLSVQAIWVSCHHVQWIVGAGSMLGLLGRVIEGGVFWKAIDAMVFEGMQAIGVIGVVICYGLDEGGKIVGILLSHAGQHC